MKIIKRDGHMVDYSPEKIEAAIMKANKEVAEEDQASPTQIKNIIKFAMFLYNLFLITIYIVESNITVNIII